MEVKRIMEKNSGKLFRGFWLRLVAALLDYYVFYAVFALLVLGVVIAVTGIKSFPEIFVKSFLGNPLLLYIYWFVIPAGIFSVVCWAVFSATPGKMIVRAKIVDATTGLKPSITKLIIRYLAYILSAFPFGMGFIWIAFDSRKQGWHDKLANTIVSNKNSILETAFFPTNPTLRETKAFRAVFTLTCLLFVIVVPLAVKTLFFDDTLTPEIKAWMADENLRCGQEKNAYYYLTGIMVSEDDDPYKDGKKQVENYQKAINEHKDQLAELELKESEKIQLGEDAKDICDPLNKECVKTYVGTDYEKMLPGHSYITVMKRYDRLYEYTCYQTTLKPDIVTPIISYGGLKQIQCLKLASIADAYVKGDKEAAIARFEKDMQFYRSMLAQADTLIAKLVFLTWLKRDIHYYSQLMDTEKDMFEMLNKFGEKIIPLNLQERSLSLAFKYEIKANVNTTLETLAYVFTKYKNENEPENEDDYEEVIGDILAQMTPQERKKAMIWLFKDNATIKSYYKIYDCISKISDMEIGNFLANKGKCENNHASYYDYIHNPIGTILASIATPAYSDYALKFHDANGLIRLVQLKRLIRLNKVPEDKIEQFLKDNSKEYGDSYSGLPMKWDAKRKVISFKPVSGKSKPFDYEIAIPDINKDLSPAAAGPK
jgi:uncharacterized RDD family membrane protein YckC